MNTKATHTVIIPAALTQVAVSSRETNGKYANLTGKGYCVATDLNQLALFCILKSFSPNTGKIYDLGENMNKILAITNISERSLYYQINKLIEMGLIRTIKGIKYGRLRYLSLISWEKLAEIYGYSYHRQKPFIPVTYEINNPLHKPKYILIQAEILANQNKQSYKIACKKRECLRNYAQAIGVPESQVKIPNPRYQTPEELTKISNQVLRDFIKLFTTRNPEKVESEQTLHEYYLRFVSNINPSLNRGLFGFKRTYGFMSIQRVTYMKKQLEKRGLGYFRRNVKILSPVHNRAPKFLEDTGTGILIKKSMKGIYDQNLNQPGIWLPDQFLIKTPQN